MANNVNPSRLALLTAGLLGALTLKLFDSTPQANSMVVEPSVRNGAVSAQQQSASIWPVRRPIENDVVDIFSTSRSAPPAQAEAVAAAEALPEPTPTVQQPPPPRPIFGPPYEPVPPFVAPALPYTVVGSWTEPGGQASLFIANQSKVLAVKEGDQIDGVFAVTSLNADSAVVTHMASGQTQELRWDRQP